MNVYADSDSGSSGMSGCPDSDSNSTEMSEHANDKETTELSFQGLDGVLCNLSVYTTTQCLMDIELGNIRKQTINIVIRAQQ